MLFVDADRFFVKRNQFMVFTSPRIGPSVIRIRESTNARLITIIYGRCSDPCHLHDNRFTHNRFIYIFICGFRSQMFYTANHVVRSRKESRMIMVRKFVHRYLQWRGQHIRHMMCHRPDKVIDVTEKFFSGLITVLFHSCQKPCDRLHECIIVHDGIPLVTFKPVARIPVMFRKDQCIRIRIFHGCSEFLPEIMVIFIAASQICCHIQTPSIYIIRRWYPFPPDI